tara:strand:- start:502 stop:891 length:390 start_codon:yes stop_codon:yes gene_type:complete
MVLAVTNENYELNTFYGSLEFTSLSPVFPKYCVSEGVKHLMERCHATWLVTDVVAWHSCATHNSSRLMVATLTVDRENERGDGILNITDENGMGYYSKLYSLVSLKDGKYELWIAWNGDGYTVYLPSEH